MIIFNNPKRIILSQQFNILGISFCIFEIGFGKYKLIRLSSSSSSIVLYHYIYIILKLNNIISRTLLGFR